MEQKIRKGLNVLGLKIIAPIINANTFKVRNFIEILEELPNGTTLCGANVDKTASCLYLFFHNEIFPETTGEKCPYLDPIFKKIGRNGKNAKLIDIGYPEGFELRG